MSVTPSCARGMATLKDIETRLKSVKNIKKITSSMKMVSAAKFTRAEKALKVSCDLDSCGLELAVPVYLFFHRLSFLSQASQFMR